MGLAREGALASVGDLERPAVARRLEVAADEDERDFHVARAVLVGRARRELDDAELRQLHLVLAHVEDLVVALLRFAADEKIVAHFQIFLSSCILLQSPPSPQAKQPNMPYFAREHVYRHLQTAEWRSRGTAREGAQPPRGTAHV